MFSLNWSYISCFLEQPLVVLLYTLSKLIITSRLKLQWYFPLILTFNRWRDRCPVIGFYAMTYDPPSSLRLQQGVLRHCNCLDGAVCGNSSRVAMLMNLFTFAVFECHCIYSSCFRNFGISWTSLELMKKMKWYSIKFKRDNRSLSCAAFVRFF